MTSPPLLQTIAQEAATIMTQNNELDGDSSDSSSRKRRAISDVVTPVVETFGAVAGAVSGVFGALWDALEPFIRAGQFPYEEAAKNLKELADGIEVDKEAARLSPVR